MARQMKESGIEWIGEIPEGWEIARLKQKFDFGKGLPITKDDLVEQGIPVISYGQIHSKLNTGVAIREELIRYVPENFRTTNSSSFVAKNDFILADTSEDLLGCGNCVFVDQDAELFAGYHTIILRATTEHDNKYLAYLFLTDAWRSQIRAKVSGVKLFSISRKILSEATIILPPAYEQHRIAAFLDRKCAEIDAVIERTKATIEEYKKLKQAAICEIAIHGIRQNRVLKDSGIEWIGKIPSEWEIVKNSRLFRENVRAPRPEDVSLSLSQKDGLVATDDMKEKAMKTSTYEDWKRVCIDDLVLNRFKAHLGVLFAATLEGMVSFHYGVYEPQMPLVTKYYEYLCHTDAYRAIYANKSNGMVVGLQNLSNANFYSVQSLYPPLEEQREIVAYLDEKCAALDTLIAKKTALLTELETYKKSLIYEYVTGKKEVTA